MGDAAELLPFCAFFSAIRELGMTAPSAICLFRNRHTGGLAAILSEWRGIPRRRLNRSRAAADRAGAEHFS